MRYLKIFKVGLVSVVTILALCACGGNIEEVSDDLTFKEENTTQKEISEMVTTKEIAGEATTKNSEIKTSTEITTKATTEKETINSSTSKKEEITTKKQETTEKQTTKQPTTTKLQTTTKKQQQTTTKSQTTTTNKQQPTTAKQTTTTKQQPTTTKKEEVTTTQAVALTYTINVKSLGDMPLSDIRINIYADSTHKVLKGTVTTDNYGMAEIILDKSDNYSAVLSDVPVGYKVADSYKFDGGNLFISLDSSVIKGSMPAGLGVGDVMYDMTVTSPDGTEYTISEILKNKNMVMLNFWFSTCTYCLQEFPYIQSAYDKYKNDIEILAINPYDATASNVNYIRENYGVTFPLTPCDFSAPTAFGVSGYPTTVIIDKYGVIREVEVGARIYASYWENLFLGYADDK